MKLRIFKAALAGLVLSLSNIANAGLIQTDYMNINDGLLVKDTSTGYEWATLTLNQHSVDQFMNSSIFANQGFIVANAVDLIHLFTSAGGTNIGMGNNTGAVNAAASIVIKNLFHHTSPFTASSGNPWIHGYYDNGSGGFDTGRVAAQGYENSHSFTIGSNNLNNVTSSHTHSAYTVWAYRTTAVPEPSTLAIFALGIMGLASRRFKKH